MSSTNKAKSTVMSSLHHASQQIRCADPDKFLIPRLEANEEKRNFPVTMLDLGFYRFGFPRPSNGRSLQSV